MKQLKDATDEIKEKFYKETTSLSEKWLYMVKVYFEFRYNYGDPYHI